MPDHLRVAEEIAEALRANDAHPHNERALLMATDKAIVSAILAREYGDARRNALEEAARICEVVGYRGQWKTGSECAAVIRAAKEETHE